ITYTMYYILSLLPVHPSLSSSFFFFSITSPPEIYLLSLHDALPISGPLRFTAVRSVVRHLSVCISVFWRPCPRVHVAKKRICIRSEEHTSELQSRFDLVCRLLLEKKKKDGCHFYSSHLLDMRITVES